MGASMFPLVLTDLVRWSRSRLTGNRL